jgi:hypothetical protein
MRTRLIAAAIALTLVGCLRTSEKDMPESRDLQVRRAAAGMKAFLLALRRGSITSLETFYVPLSCETPVAMSAESVQRRGVRRRYDGEVLRSMTPKLANSIRETTLSLPRASRIDARFGVVAFDKMDRRTAWIFFDRLPGQIEVNYATATAAGPLRDVVLYWSRPTGSALSKSPSAAVTGGKGLAEADR